jgi:hypothetical protein
LFIDLVDVCELYEIPRPILEITITYNPECKELIEKIINRYGLNIGLDMHQKIYIVDDTKDWVYKKKWRSTLSGMSASENRRRVRLY